MLCKKIKNISTHCLIFLFIKVDVSIQNFYEQLDLQRRVHALICYL